MSEDTKTKIPWIIAAAALIAAVFMAMTRSDLPDYESTSTERADSLSEIVSADGVTISRLNRQIDSIKVTELVSFDSLAESRKSSEKSVKVVIRTIYKDSVKEVYVEKTEAMAEYQRTLTTLRDSISVLNARISEESDRKDSSSVKENIRASSYEKSASVTKKADRPGYAGITSGIRVHHDASVSKEIRGYVIRKIIGPVFVGADASWETGESLHGTAGTGILLGPFKGYVGAGYDGEPCVKAAVSADFTF